MADTSALLQMILDRLGAIEGALGLSGAGGSSGAAAEEDPRQIRAYDEYCRTYLDPFVAAGATLGGGAEVASGLVARAWAAQRDFLLMAAKCQKPADLPKIHAKLAPVLAIQKEIRDAVARGPWENHLKTVNEGAQALNWLAISPAPRDFIESCVGGADFWGNKIRVEFRKTNPDQMAFVDGFKNLIVELMPYVKEFHTTGVSWNPRGVDVDSYAPSGSAPAAASAVAATSAAPVAAAAAPAAQTKSGAPGANLFGALNKGGDITSGLKKVSRDQQTWRAEYKADAPAPAPAKPSARAPASAKAQVKGPPRLNFDVAGNKWEVEHQSKDQGVVQITVTDIKHTVYVYGCVDATINITGKCKSVMIDGCKKTQVLFDELVSSCEIVNSQRIQIQARNKIPSIAIDKTDGILVYLSRDSLNVEITSSKSSEMNVSFPDANGDMIERCIPEQFVARIVADGNNYSITTTVSDLYTH